MQVQLAPLENAMQERNGVSFRKVVKNPIHLTQMRLLAVLALAGLVAAPALAQAGGRARLYNTATETTLQGTVRAVTNPAGRRGWSGTHLSLQSGGQTYDVHVGPSAYVANAGFTFAAGDRIEVTGSKVQLNGAGAIIAREITKDGKVLALRDKQGFPKWSGGRRNAQ